MSHDAQKDRISIVVPVYNSANILPHLLKAIEEERKRNSWDLELIMVDDGSKDGSFKQIVELKKEFGYIKGIKLSRNFGHQNALRVGLESACGDYVAIIDDDLQDPPSLLPRFLELLKGGHDVVYGVRRKRKEFFLKVWAYLYFYRILRWMSEVEIPLDSGDFCFMNRKVVQAMLQFNERNPFLRGIRAWVGWKQIGIEYDRGNRLTGQSGYTLTRLFKMAFDGIYSFSDLPLRMTSILGAVGLALAVIYGLYILGKHFLFGMEVPGFTTLTLLILIFGSLNLICLGIIGEYLARIYAEGKNRPYALIDQII